MGIKRHKSGMYYATQGNLVVLHKNRHCAHVKAARLTMESNLQAIWRA
jgi:hypothetical protein